MRQKRIIGLILAVCCALALNFTGVTTGVQTEAADTESSIPDGMLNVTQTSIRVSGISHTYKFLQVSDSHIVVPSSNTSSFYYAESLQRLNHFTSLGGGTKSSDRFPYFFRYAEENNINAVLLTGDIIDFPSQENVNYLNSVLDGSTVQHLFTPGNHDWTYPTQYFTAYGRNNYRPMLNHAATNGGLQASYLEYEDLIVLAIDDSEDMIYYAEVVNTIKNVIIPKHKPVIVICHVPMYAPTLSQSIIAIWGRDLSVGPHRGSGYYNANTKYVYEWITSAASPVVAVLAGHLHYDHYDLAGNTKPQYICEPGYEGKARLLTVSPTPCAVHTWDEGEVITRATLTDGLTHYTCTVCGDTMDVVTPAIYTLGDIDGSDGISAADSLMMKKFLSRNVTFTADERLIADLNGDGKVNARDSRLMRKYLAGQINSFD